MAKGSEANPLGLNKDMEIALVDSVPFCLATLVKKITQHNDNVVRAGNHFAGTPQDKVAL